MMRKVLLTLALCSMLFGGLAAARDCNLIPNRLSGAKVGEWASYRLPNGYIQKLTVMDRTTPGEDAIVTIKVENILEGKVVTTKEITQEAGPALNAPVPPSEEGVTVAVRNDTARVNDRNVAVGVVEISTFLGAGDEDNTSTEWWVTCEVPVFGIVKKVTDGAVQWELDEFGFAETGAKADAKK